MAQDTAKPGAMTSTESEELLTALRHGDPAARDAAVADLHVLLLRGAHHELRRRRNTLAAASREELDDLAVQAADDALAAILGKLDTFRGASRFTTWAYKFVLLEAGVRARRRTWQDREVVLADESWRALADPKAGVHRSAEEAELIRLVTGALDTALTPHQRQVFVALALNSVPIDVLAERAGSTRGALYKTLHDARRRLRDVLADAGYPIGDDTRGGG